MGRSVMITHRSGKIMKTIIRSCLPLALLLGSALVARVPGVKVPVAPGPDPKLVQMQVILDRLGFSPGVIDGKPGFTLKLALMGLQKANGLPATGAAEPKTAAILDKYVSMPAILPVTLSAQDLAGPFVGPIPRKEDEQAKLPSLGYSTPIEMLAERYHTTPATLTAINSGGIKIAPGAVIKVPNVIPPTKTYSATLPDGYKQTLAGLNVGSDQPQADHLVVSKAERSLAVVDAQGKVVAQFPVTTGSDHDPLPIGQWKITEPYFNPEFHFNPKLFWDAKRGEKKATLQPGPNNPVGVVWLNLSIPHYGIHGTPEPQNIGRTESHGCVRMTNWDAARLSLMIKPGTPVTFQP